MDKSDQRLMLRKTIKSIIIVFNHRDLTQCCAEKTRSCTTELRRDFTQSYTKKIIPFALYLFGIQL